MRPFRAYALGLAALLVPAAMQLALFAFFARVLGAEGYGLYLVLMSWSPICFELAGWGAGEYLLKRTTQDRGGFRDARRHLRAAFVLSLPLATASFVVLTLGIAGSPINPWIIAVVGFAEFAGLRLFVNAEQMALALGRVGLANWLRAGQVAPRIVGVLVVYVVWQRQSVDELALGASLGMLLAGLATAWLVSRRLPAATGAALAASGVREGTWFMGTQLVRAGQHNIDRIVLAPLVDPTTLGLYGAAQRFLQIGMLPLQAVMRLAYPGFFRSGAGGIAAALRHGITIVPAAVGAAAVTALGLGFVSQWLPLLTGAEFAQSASYLLYLAPVLVLSAVNSVASDVLSGAGFLPLRLLLTVAGVAVQAAMFWAFHDDTEIILASYAGVGCSCLLTGGAVVFLVWRAGRRSKTVAALA